MSGRIYTISADAVSETTAQDLIRIQSPSDAILVIHDVVVSQETLDAPEQLAIQLQRSSTTGTGAAITARPLDVGDAGFSGSAIGTITADTTFVALMYREAWNILNPFKYFPAPEQRIVLGVSGGSAGIFVVRLDEAPSAAMLISTTVTVEEIG